MTSNGNDGVTTGHMDAVRFSPTINETLKSVQMLMYSTQETGQNYTSGTISVAIWDSTTDESAPKGPPLQQLNVSATRVPQDGFLNVSGFDIKVTAGSDYWIVFSLSFSSLSLEMVEPLGLSHRKDPRSMRLPSPSRKRLLELLLLVKSKQL
jgi:hypothetical protein